MKLNLACSRFKKLWNERDERHLSPNEIRFLDKHRSMCPQCREFEASADVALGLLRDAVLEPSVSSNFDERLIRRARVQGVRQSLGYWSPALVGGFIACLALIAALQIAATPVQLKKATLPEGEAKVGASIEHALPKLILSDKPIIR